MPAHSGEIIDQIAPRFAATRHAQLFGIDVMIAKPGFQARNIRRNGRTCSVHNEPTHTDPQLLFWAAS